MWFLIEKRLLVKPILISPVKSLILKMHVTIILKNGGYVYVFKTILINCVFTLPDYDDKVSLIEKTVGNVCCFELFKEIF